MAYRRARANDSSRPTRPHAATRAGRRAGGALAVALAALAPHAGASAASTQPLASIVDAARAFVRDAHGEDSSLEIAARAPDPRLRLPACAAPLEAGWAVGSATVGRVTVQVRCPTATPWRVHLALEVTRESEIWVLARDVRRGETLAREHLARRRLTLGRGASPRGRVGALIASPEARLGEEFTRDVASGEPLGERLLAPPRLVTRNATVRVRRLLAGLAVEAEGVALEDGARGERVRVRNLSSGRTIEAIVTARDRVEIPR